MDISHLTAPLGGKSAGHLGDSPKHSSTVRVLIECDIYLYIYIYT